MTPVCRADPAMRRLSSLSSVAATTRALPSRSAGLYALCNTTISPDILDMSGEMFSAITVILAPNPIRARTLWNALRPPPTISTSLPLISIINGKYANSILLFYFSRDAALYGRATNSMPPIMLPSVTTMRL